MVTVSGTGDISIYLYQLRNEMMTVPVDFMIAQFSYNLTKH